MRRGPRYLAVAAIAPGLATAAVAGAQTAPYAPVTTPTVPSLPAPAPRHPFSRVSAPFRPAVQFRVTYAGAGNWRTVYHSTPPNPGGHPDTNDAHDASSVHWSLHFVRTLGLPVCAPSRGAADPCRRLRLLTGATGRSSAVGRVSHRHQDGLYTALNSGIACRMAVATPRGLRLAASIRLAYDPAAGTLAITALTPVRDALGELPAQCPSQGDSLDGLLDSYFTPGFSFSSRFGPDRWFTAATVRIRLAVLRRSARIRIPLAQTRAGTPPARCAVHSPSFERCSTGGSWRGVLTLTRVR